MARLSLLLAIGACLLSTTCAIDPNLVGTWTTKSAKVLTGPGFYNPVNDSFIEPAMTGISYSFTADGFYEEAYYRAISNPTTPSCPQAILQFQHGTFTANADGSLKMTPFAVDGRQLLSSPCDGTTSMYTRYNQTETMQKWQVYVDTYKGVKRLDLYEFDGSLMNPMYLAHTPPQMLPTITMNPTAAATSSPSSTAKAKRGLDALEVPFNKYAEHIKRDNERKPLDANLVWWAGIGMTIFGGAAYLL
ncbi:MAG: Reversal of tor2 lethality [Claussenomyces sp. TS43310]|nr:MAG: Reversal of tor2 lethality [Claussenomyces sp. TS43310]